MIRPISLLFALTVLGSVGRSDAAQVIRRACELVLPGYHVKAAQTPYDIEGEVVFVSRAENSFFVRDASGHAEIKHPFPPIPDDLVGCRVRVTGHLQVEEYLRNFKVTTNVQVIARGAARPPVEAGTSDILGGTLVGRTVRLRGLVSDICPDALDPRFLLLSIVGDTGTVGCCVQAKFLPRPRDYLGAEVAVTGFCNRFPPGHRRFQGPVLILSDESSIEILHAPPDDPFAVPSLEKTDNVTPQSILSLGRRSVTGRVLAAWSRVHVLVRTSSGGVSLVEMAEPDRLPVCGDIIDASGFPDTDLYHLNLYRAMWRKSSRGISYPECAPHDTTAEKLLYGMNGQKCVPIRFHGDRIHLRGQVVTLPTDENDCLNLRNGKFLVPVNVSACPQVLPTLSVGCTLDMTGICLLDIISPTPNRLVPGIEGFTLIVQRPDDIVILSRPSWWTPARLLLVIGVLLALICVILVWNLLLRKLAEKRGKELARESIARTAANLRVGERTRLAVELHDTLVQNMTGVAIALRTRNYDLAAKTLDFCRKDLRNCLWDLRNLTLDDADINAAIRKTLAPHVADARLQVRFSVPREKFTDNTTHAILCILRELTINAVRHGNATAIWVAGSTEGDKLLFSVKDNGCGFDPAAAPGMAEGHFGLQGILDRVEGFEGRMTVESAPGKGAKVTIALNMSNLDNPHLT